MPTKVKAGLVIPKNNYAMGEQPLVVKDGVTGLPIEVTILIDEDGNMLRPIQEDSRLDMIVDELQKLNALVALAVQ